MKAVRNDQRLISRQRRNGRRRNSGSAFIELACMGFILPVLAVISANVGLLVFAAWTNDAACRDAARCASEQGNKSDAVVAAACAAKRYATAGGILGNPKVLTGETEFTYEPFFDKDGVPQLSKGPFVTVTTRMNAVLPLPMYVSEKGLTRFVVFKQSYTFPLMNPNQQDKITPMFNPSLAAQEEDHLQDAIEQAAATARAQAEQLAAEQAQQSAQASSADPAGPTAQVPQQPSEPPV